MKNLFHHLPYALVSPQHLSHWLARIAAADLRRATRLAKFIQDDDGDDDDEPEGEPDPEDNPGNQPWWKTEDIWGDPLPAPYMRGSAAVIPVKGVLTTGYPTIYRAIGIADMEEIGEWVTEAAAESTADRIVMPYDSPGGIYTGTPELAAIINEASKVKPVIAFTKGMMDSAAYWTASQSTACYCTQSADVGCIGVYQVHLDYSQMARDMGVVAEMFKSGDLKGAGYPYIPLTPEQKADIQKTIERIGAEFRAAVTSKRTLVNADSMRGQSFIGSEAVERGLCAGLRSFESLF